MGFFSFICMTWNFDFYSEVSWMNFQDICMCQQETTIPLWTSLISKYNCNIFFFPTAIFTRLLGNFSWCWSDIFLISLKNILHSCLCMNLGLHLVSCCSNTGWLKSLFPFVAWSLQTLQASSCTSLVYLLYQCLFLCHLDGLEVKEKAESSYSTGGNTVIALACAKQLDAVGLPSRPRVV